MLYGEATLFHIHGNKGAVQARLPKISNPFPLMQANSSRHIANKMFSISLNSMEFAYVIRISMSSTIIKTWLDFKRRVSDVCSLDTQKAISRMQQFCYAARQLEGNFALNYIKTGQLI